MGEDFRFLGCEESRGGERGVGFGAGDVEAGGLIVIPGGEGGFFMGVVAFPLDYPLARGVPGAEAPLFLGGGVSPG